MEKMATIMAAINKSIGEVFRHASFRDWMEKEKKHGGDAGDIIFINNSFVFRDVKTKKSDLYLAVEVGQNGLPSGNTFIGHPQSNMNSDFRYCTPAERMSLVGLEIKIKEQMGALGQLVFILIGCVRDDAVIEALLSHPVFKKLVWNPRIKSVIHIDEKEITIRNVQDWEIIWQKLAAHFREMLEKDPKKYIEEKYRKPSRKKKKDTEQNPSQDEPIDLPKAIEKEIEDLKKAMEAGILDLQDQAFANLVIPNSKKRRENPQQILCRIVDALTIEKDKYITALKDYKSDALNAEQALHEILRISYNFEKEAITLLNLIVSVCDLKPVILWGTLYQHYALSDAFRDLPWFTKAYKPSLKNYKSIIDDARNSAFHNVFPFQKTLEIALPQSALREAKLRIFSEYENKKENALNFQDKELVDVLLEFTRARRRPAALDFWDKNLVVMESLIALFRETGRFLLMLR
jgi:hypothetical protein